MVQSASPILGYSRFNSRKAWMIPTEMTRPLIGSGLPAYRHDARALGENEQRSLSVANPRAAVPHPQWRCQREAPPT